jgi:hypothetical protein
MRVILGPWRSTANMSAITPPTVPSQQVIVAIPTPRSAVIRTQLAPPVSTPSGLEKDETFIPAGRKERTDQSLAHGLDQGAAFSTTHRLEIEYG